MGSWPRWREIQRHQSQARRSINVPVLLLTCGYADGAQREFYARFAELVLGAIHPRLSIRIVGDEVNRFDAIMEELTKSAPRDWMVVGPWSILARSGHHRVEFSPIPCWWHRLACLSLETNREQLSWEDVRTGAQAQSPARGLLGGRRGG